MLPITYGGILLLFQNVENCSITLKYFDFLKHFLCNYEIMHWLISHLSFGLMFYLQCKSFIYSPKINL